MDNRFDLIFGTCNEYSFLWDGYFKLLKKYWPEFNSRVISTASSFHASHFDVIGIKNTKGSFSGRLLDALKLSDKDIVLFTLDDFYLWRPVSHIFFEHALEIMRNDPEIKCINLHDTPSENYYFNGDYDDRFCYKKQKDHIITTQLSLWNKRYLIKLLRRGEAAWDFEFYATIRQYHYAGSILYPKDRSRFLFAYPKSGIMVKGGINPNPEVFAFLEAEGIEIALPPSLANVAKTKSPAQRLLIQTYNRLVAIYDVIYRRYNWLLRLPFFPKINV